MADFYRGVIPILDPTVGADRDVLFPKGVSYGGIPRDYKVQPESVFQHPSEMSLIPESEVEARVAEQEATKSSMEHIYLGGPNETPMFTCLDQGPYGDCWAFSTGHAIMLDRLAQNQPIIRVSSAGVATMLGRPDMGGWNGLSAQFARENGYPEEGKGEGQWPAQSHNRSYDTPALREKMKRYKTTEEWADLTKEVYDQNLTRAQLWTALLHNNSCMTDFYWWGHSVCAVRWIKLEPGGFGLLILNSWKNWGHHGLGVLRGSQSIPNAAISVRFTTSS